jgi:tRNA pseudouridine55 synthase
LISYELPHITLDVTVSKGTYIRVLGKDLAEKLGTVGYLNKLVRTRVSQYLLKDSITITEFEKKWKS